MQTPTSDLSRVFAQLIQARHVRLPPMPGTAAEVLDLCQQADADAAMLSEVIHKDQTIASNVLRVANSAAYGGQVPCASLQQAVSRLGLQLVTEIVTAVSMRGRMFKNEQCVELLDALWKHSVMTAFYSKEIARLRKRSVDIAFLCGLLHDVGKAVLLGSVDRVLGNEELTVPRDELFAAIHEQHIAAGQLLADEWKLPALVAEAIECHHEEGLADSSADMAKMVFLADQLSYSLAPCGLEPAMSEDALRAHPIVPGLGLTGEDLEALLAMRERALEVTEGMS